MADHNLCFALRATPGAPPMEVFPPPPAQCTREEVVARVNAFLTVVRWELLRLKREGRFNQVADLTPEPAKAGVVLVFPSLGKLHEVMERVRAGETVDPTAMERVRAGETVDPTAHGQLAMYCSDGLYDHATAFAAQRGRAFKDVLVYVVTSYVDLAGQEQTLRSVLLDPEMAGE